MTLSLSSFSRQLGTLAVFAQLLTIGCSSKDEGNGPSGNKPCDNELLGQCGGACKTDKDCGNFQYCNSAGTCTSDCTPAGAQCQGECPTNGRCATLVPSLSAAPLESGDVVIDVPGASTSNGGIDMACATGNVSAKLSDVNMYIMFDQSLSMLDNNKWVDASDALVDFLQDPGTDGLNIALRFFPSNLPLEGCVDENADSDLSCSTSACEQPLVNVGLVTSQAGDPQETLLVSAIQEASPGSGVQGAIDDNGNPDYQRGGGTPISAALGGAIQWSAKYQQQHTDQKTVVVFVTDGEPYGCNESTTAIAALAAEGSNAGIPTYSIGLEGSAEDLMRAIAQSGGTGDPFFIGSGDNASQDLLQALNEIRGKALSCDFEVPDSNGGGQINPNQVNVTLTAGGATNSFFKVESAANCDSSSAWYYDNNANPTRMILCQAACDQVLSQADASLEIVFGCATMTTPPMQN